MVGFLLLVFSISPGVIDDEPPLTFVRVEHIQVELAEPMPLPIIIWDEAREDWLDELIICESGGNPNALNPIDRDGTPSHGILQFKDTTFAMYADRYGIIAELYDASAQKQMVRYMMDDARVVWHNEFPDCVRRLGVPPGVNY